jgi:hypothetical protein
MVGAVAKSKKKSSTASGSKHGGSSGRKLTPIGMGRKAEKGRATVVAGGKVFDIRASMDFQTTVKKVAERAGLSRFHVFVDGKEVKDPESAPKDFRGIEEQVVISRYDKGG